MKYLLFTFLILLLITGCLFRTGCSLISNKGVVYLTDINKDTTIRIPLKLFSSPVGVQLKVSGMVEDTCSFGQLLILPKGRIDTLFKYEYYIKDVFIIDYYKYKSKKSTLKIEYIL